MNIKKESVTIKLPTQVAEAIGRLEGAGFEAYAVGGCVRDTLMGRVPNDWDVTTSATPEQTLACFADKKTLDIGIAHGTITVLMGGMPLEITTYRCDGEYLDNRHPSSVLFTKKIDDDLSRRDFTVNAMAYHPQKGFVDLFGGRDDLAARRISCVGDATVRFEEDGLRIMRAIRFASVLDFEIAESTASAIHARRDLLSNIAIERIREELCKLICGAGAVRILREYADVIGVVIPELLACVGFSQNTKYHCYDVYEHTLQSLAYNDGADLCTRMAILLHDVGKPLSYTEDEAGVGHFKGHSVVGERMTEQIMRRLRFDNATAQTVVSLVGYHDRDVSADRREVKRLMQVMPDADILRLVEVKRCDRLAHASSYSTPPESLEQIPSVLAQIREAGECVVLKDLCVNGKDLLALGVPAGKRLGEILNRLLDCVIDERLPNEREALLAAAKEML